MAIRIVGIMLLGMSLMGCSGTHYSYIQSDIPGVADALEPLMTAENNLIGNDKETYHRRVADRGPGILGEGAGYYEECGVDRPKSK